MPELPDLNVYASTLQNNFGGCVISDCKSIKTKRLNVSESVLRDALKGAALDAVTRSGKELEFNFSTGHSVRIHLMLKGYFAVTKDTPDTVKYARVALQFDSTIWLVIADPQGWAVTELDTDVSAVPDALDEAFAYEQFEAAIEKYRKKPIKALLLDQDVLLGIGNAYADEILYKAGVAPASHCSAIPENIRKHVYDSISTVLTAATTELETRHPGIMSGEYREFLKVHRKDVSITEAGEEILKAKVASRTAYYTATQTLYE